ncbi:MAG: GTP-binding protein, partial [Candidatus Binatia bacterium]
MAVGLSAIRTLAVAGQGGAGKTSVADAMVFAAGGNNRLGRVDEGNSVFDTEPEEIRHGCSVSTSLFHVTWKKYDVTILDTPGQGNFVQELRPVLRGVAGVIMVLDAASQPRAEATKVRSWTQAEKLPTLGFINRLDRSDQDFATILGQARDILGPHAVALQLPILSEGRVVGLVDLVSEKALVFEAASGKFKVGEIPGEMTESVAEYRNTLM